MRVRAVRDCYVGEIYRNEGDEFDVEDSYEEVLKKQAPKDVVLVKADAPLQAEEKKSLPLFAPGVPQPKTGYGQSQTRTVESVPGALAQGGASGKLGASKKVI